MDNRTIEEVRENETRLINEIRQLELENEQLKKQQKEFIKYLNSRLKDIDFATGSYGSNTDYLSGKKEMTIEILSIWRIMVKYNLEKDAKIVNKEYKKMKYGSNRIQEILLEGRVKDYPFYILNLGTHPTAYIEIPVDSELFGKGYNEIYEMGLDLEVHGGLTYSNNYLSGIKDNSWFIGWDYAHAGDYVGYDVNFSEFTDTEKKKWTTEEIYNEVCCAIDQIIDFNMFDENKYGEVINGKNTYRTIANRLKANKSIGIGWTDGYSAHLDIIFNLGFEKTGTFQRGIKNNYLVVSIIDHTSYAFAPDTIKVGNYIQEKLRMNNDWGDKLAELINGIISELAGVKDEQSL